MKRRRGGSGSLDSAGQRTTALVLVAFVTACAIARPQRPETGTETGRECVNRCDADAETCDPGRVERASGGGADWPTALGALFVSSVGAAHARDRCMRTLTACYVSCRREAAE